MNDVASQGATRREFLQNTGRAVAATALAGVVVPAVHAAENNTIQVALIGCGGRGTKATVEALKTSNQGPIKLVAMADVFKNKMDTSFASVNRALPNQVDVKDRQFLGFDAHKKAMDCLKPGDVAIFTTPLAFRARFFAYAIEKGLNVFMEKPLTADGPTSKRMFALGEEARKKNLKVGVGLMCRHCDARLELLKRIQDGAIGEISFLRAYRMGGPSGLTDGPQRANETELEYQIRKFHSFIWASGGLFSDYLIHNIDECCWMKGAWPVKAQATGGRNFRRNSLDQNFDTYNVEYIFPDSSRLFLQGRYIAGTYGEFASYAHGTKGSAVISTRVHTPAKCRIYRGQDVTKNDDLLWAFPQPERSPYQIEWDDLIAAIRSDKPYNEVQRGVEASIVTSMGRMAAHTGQIVTFEDMLNHEHELAPGADSFTKDSPAPVQLDSDGKYPQPQPGLKTKREY